MDIENWKSIPNFEGYYEASTLGRIRSIQRSRTKGGILKPSLTGSGYPHLTLCAKGKKYSYDVHRLIALTFLDNPNNLQEVNHKDENKQNNSVTNLEWCDRLHNQRYGTAIERMSKSHNYKESNKKGALKHDYVTQGLKRRKPIIQMDLEGNIIKKWSGGVEISKELNLSSSSISSACSNGTKLKGYYSTFAEHKL